MNNKFITKRNYIRSLVCQPYFVWNSLSKKEDDELDEQDFLDLLWDEDEEIEQGENFGQRMAKTFRLVDDKLVEQLAKSGQIEVIKGTTEAAIEATKSLLDSGKILIAPVFEYRGAIAKPFAFDTVSKTIISIKYSLKTKRIDFAKGYYDYAIVAKVTQVNSFQLYLPVNVPMKKGQIDLIAIDSGWATTSSHLPEETASEGKKMSAQNFLECFKRGFFYTAKLNNGQFDANSVILFEPIEDIIAHIENCKNEKAISANISSDLTVWGFNPEWNELLTSINCPYADFSGKVISKKKIIDSLRLEGENVTFSLGALHSAVGDNLVEGNETNSPDEPIIDLQKLGEVEIINSAKKVIWYDFEGFSLPIAPLDYVLPYRQVVFQVSVIETDNNKETRVDNLVVDPRHISLDDFVQIIKTIYRKNVDAYVVYNRSYELSRMNEMLLLLQKAKHKAAAEFASMLDEIVAKTVDLYNLFAINSPRKMPAILLPDQKGRASIKNVEKYITKHGIKLPRAITPYKELEVSNGGMAMSLAIDRALDIIGDQEWAGKVVSLKKYCENDVRAMIMVYDFALMLGGHDVD